jgi:GNAT superfamily N-acetyltransferase
MKNGMPNCVIRKAKIKDASSIIELLSDLGRPKPKQNEIKLFAKMIQKYIFDKDKTILVANIDSEVVGMISLLFLPRLNRTRPEAWVPDFIVNHEYRNKGIGRALIKRCVLIARKEKCWRIRLETGLSRKRSQRFYELMQMKPFALSFTLQL